MMLSSVSQGRALMAGQAFGSVRPRVAPRIADSSVCRMGRKDSYMVEVEVGEDEPEDVAVRRYMKLVMQSRVVEKLRARKTRETKIEEYKRRFRERCEMRKSGFVDPTYEELYSTELDPRPFDDFFQRRDEEDPEGAYDGMGLPSSTDDIFGTFVGGGYVDNWAQYPRAGYLSGSGKATGNANNWQGGYLQ